jgi:LPS export ABC transporter protein LptC
LLIGCGEENSTTKASRVTPTDTLQPDQITYDAHIYLYRAGHKTTDLLADEIRQFTSRDSSVAINLHVQFFDTTGARMSTLTAKKGYIRERHNFLAVTGSVVVIGEDSSKVLTEYLEWDANKDQVVTDSFVTVINGEDTLRSYGMETDPKLENTTFKRKVSASLTDVEKVQDDEK